LSSRGEFVRFCSKGCENAYKRENPSVILGLAGKAIGGAISGVKDRKQAQAQQESYDHEFRQQQLEEEQEMRQQERAAASAARHVITHEIVCPICDADVSASLASDGKTKVRCKECKTRLQISHDGDVKVLGPKDNELSGAESLEIKEDRLCSRCKYFVKEGVKWKKWFVVMAIVGLGGFIAWETGVLLYRIGAIAGTLLAAIIALMSLYVPFDKCGNKDAVSASGMDCPSNVNANLRCKFWEKK